MSIEWILYLIDLLDNFNTCVAIISIISIISFSMFSFFVYSYCNDISYRDEKSEDKRKSLSFRVAKGCAVSFLVTLVLNIMIPSKTTMYMMALANYSKDSNIPKKVIRALESKLDDIIKDGICLNKNEL
jgi:hypothetical protein